MCGDQQQQCQEQMLSGHLHTPRSKCQQLPQAESSFLRKREHAEDTGTKAFRWGEGVLLTSAGNLSIKTEFTIKTMEMLPAALVYRQADSSMQPKAERGAQYTFSTTCIGREWKTYT